MQIDTAQNWSKIEEVLVFTGHFINMCMQLENKGAQFVSMITGFLITVITRVFTFVELRPTLRPVLSIQTF